MDDKTRRIMTLKGFTMLNLGERERFSMMECDKVLDYEGRGNDS